MSYTITAQPSGRTFSVNPDETLIEAASRQGIILPYGCRDGRCGSCIGQVLSGAFEYDSEHGRQVGISAEQTADGMALFCQARATSDMSIEARLVDGIAGQDVSKFSTRVEFMEQLSHDVMRLHLKMPRNQQLEFLAGQYLEFTLPGDRARAFSIANAPHDASFIELHVRHVPNGEFTDYVFGSLEEKTMLRVRAPLGTFFLREDTQRPILMMAGGTGFAPLKGMIEHAMHLLDQNQAMQRPIHLFWGVRAKRDLYSPELPEQWANEHSGFQFTPVLSSPEPEDNWQGETGYVHEVVARTYPDLSGFDVYMSGPPVMIESAMPVFTGQGLDHEHAYSDAFVYAAPAEKPASAR